MVTVIKYTNFYGNTISEQQALQSQEYKKVIEIDGAIKRIDEYRDGVLDWVIYYKEPDETDAQILSQIRPLQPSSERYSIRTMEDYGVFKIMNERRYSNDDNDLTFEYRELIGPQGYVICSESITHAQLFPNESHVLKKFYNEEIYNTQFMIEDGREDPKFLVFRAEYYPDGSLELIIFNPNSTYDSEHYTSTDYNELVQRCNLTPEQEKYYFTADFLPAKSG